MIKLIGILIIVVGFILKLDTIGVVLLAGITTGLVSGINLHDVITIIGKEFVDKRLMSMFILTLPVIGILEKYGLRQRAAALIGKIKGASAGSILMIYQAIREIAVAFSISGLGGHVQFVRPLIFPMAQGASEGKDKKMVEDDIETLKGNAAAAENFGNFFAQNLFPASAGVLLIQSSLKDLKYDVNAVSIAKAGIPVAVLAFIFACIQYYLMDRKIKNNLVANTTVKTKVVEGGEK